MSLKKFFIPHAENNYHPHILHTKRAVLYSLVFLSAKFIVIVLALLIPREAYLHPDLLAQQYDEIIRLTNEVRAEKKTQPLEEAAKLDFSAQAKADDMVALEYFSHTSPSGRTLSDWLKGSGYVYSVAGENLGLGFQDAPTLVAAWVNSPAHYANLIDKQFKDIGVGLASGEYRGENVIYVAQHFGLEWKQPLAVVPAEAATVKGEKITTGQVKIDTKQSWVYWLERNDTTVVQIRAYLTGQIKQATVQIGPYSVDLERLTNDNIFVGHLVITGTADQFFNPIVLPTVVVTDIRGRQTASSIDWFNVKTVNPTPVEQYSQAKRLLSPITSIFRISQDIFAIFIVFFFLALTLNIVIEIRRQHRHVIAQTLLLIVFLTGLWWL